MNVLNDPWLYVIYTNGKKAQVSVRQAFKDADKIKCIETPTFHEKMVYIYDVPVIQFLSTLLLAAYYKPEHNYKSGRKIFSRELKENGWDDSIISKYFDTWESRFSLFDENYPFLQDVTLEASSTGDEFISLINPIAPGMNNVLFAGSVKSNNTNSNSYIRFFEIDCVELVYILLFIASIGYSPMAKQYPYSSLSAKASMFMLPMGETLKDTIILNALPLINNSRPNDEEDIPYDRPIWELDSTKDILKYDMETIAHNTLLCTFFTSIPIKVFSKDGKTIDSVEISSDGNQFVLDKDAVKSLGEAYIDSSPWLIKTQKVEKEVRYMTNKAWNPNEKTINLCIDLTRKLPTGTFCRMLDQENSHARCYIYFREFDKYKTSMYSCGRYEIDQDVFAALQSDEHHAKAEVLEKMLISAKEVMDIFGRESGLNKSWIREQSRKVSQDMEQFFLTDFVYNIDQEDILNRAAEKIRNLVKKYTAVLESDPFRVDFVRYVKARKELERKLYFKKYLQKPEEVV